MENMIAGLVANHLQLVEGIAVGYAASHTGPIVGFIVNQVFRIKAVRSYCAAHPAAVKAVMAEIAADVDQDVDAAVKAQGPVAHN